ncbi:SpoIIE family protein phosphatase [Mycolicibacterium austroafricanum]|uniref:histidine kinase n=1 Tax=Mycolicibacterium austroafricanum TaxID=39687 RepID=A0ABT8HCM6_MYCAO|nr:SpoIIE family protein phosphatase [Mycolicibacterium austroafricanum]MDN4518530.1 SpoIIE family protein phosphatase [Mycolicibacterium austroafricanum]PQP42101.1 histidine kinase [Mycolicibacterium austroafricanum]QRZ08558.1 SpoIIE family protein phosphatase [Mycolicibacterium austroafricanum]QZT70208.1 SpoIIE family protein phosphatase [Mycolicibacterium austroafricanum]
MTGDGRGESFSPAGIFADGGEVGRDHARVDWAATPLGPPSRWPQSLLTAASILLSSRFPMWMAWGPELTFFCNDAYRRDTLGRKYPWALGRPASEVWAEIWDDIGPRIERVLSTGQATWDTALLLFLERSGYPEETYHTFSYSPLRDDDGRVVGMLCVVSEDTERVIGERRMATLRDLGSDLSLVRSEVDILRFADEQLGQNLRDLPFTLTYLFDGDGSARLAGTSGIAPEHPAVPTRLSADGGGMWPVAEPARSESVLVDLDGDSYPSLPTGDWREPPAQALVVPLLHQGGSPSGFLVVGLNRYRLLDDGYRGFLTLVAGHIAAGIGLARSYRAQQRRAEELAELDRVKTTFFSNISHEFRTPLTLILDPVSELRRAESIDEPVRRELDVVWRNGLRLTKLVNTLLDFSRIEAGRTQARYQPVDLGALTAELASMFRSAVERAGLTFDIDCDPLDEVVYVDRDMWEKVIFNLLSNALKFTFEGAVSVRVRRDGHQAVVVVADTGTGVPADEMPRLFERFHRIENAKARSNEGSGIGLALVKELIGLHGGTIVADSAEGQGTAFTIRMPFGAAHLPDDALAPVGDGREAAGGADAYVEEALRWIPADTEADDESAHAPTGSVTSASARVLVADDNADMREYLTRLLRSDGYRVDAVADGLEALEAIRAGAPDIVVSDVMMPRLDGLGLVAELRADRRTAATPVLLLSARAGQQESISGLRAGADDYLVKPFAAAELLARVRTNVELARLRHHHAQWRTALVDSLQEAFFVCDADGAVIEINPAFTEILGYDRAGLPYRPMHPWWPSADNDPDAHRQVAEAFDSLLGNRRGTITAVPVTHRDGHRLWVTATFAHAEDPETGGDVVVGTVRDVSAEHFVVQRETALASLNESLAQADTLGDAVRAATAEFAAVWRARRVLAVTWPDGYPVDTETPVDPHLVCAGEPARWSDLPAHTRERITALRDDDLLDPDTSTAGAAGVALQHPQGVLVIYVELFERRRFTAEDHTLLTVLAGRLGQGLQRVQQIDQQRETALALQHAILGPALSGGFAVRYQPATRPLQVGGDWYDVVDLDDGRIALIVGDCVGHGLAAAAIMGQLRSACRALLLEHPSPAAALSGLDRFAARLPGARCTTAFCAVLDPETGEVVYSCAGHPPPILIGADRSTRLLEEARATPLGLKNPPHRTEARETMAPRATLLLYTDGLVERRRESIDDGIARAAGVVEDNRATALDELANAVMAGLAPADGYHDDVALLLYRQPAPLDLEFAADVAELAVGREALRGWLDRAGVGAEQSLDVLIATGEALANAIEHGHREQPRGPVRLRAIALPDRVHVTVVDSGTWKPPATVPALHRGRGIALMRALMHDVTIDSQTTGTTVHMNARIV